MYQLFAEERHRSSYPLILAGAFGTDVARRLHTASSMHYSFGWYKRSLLHRKEVHRRWIWRRALLLASWLLRAAD
jgi:hypothetical protein